ncbi:protein phosphatase 2C domain-containing protein [Streptomyces olivoreticuli]
MTRRPMDASCLLTPKEGNSESECEDAATLFPADGEFSDDVLVAAVSDGASESALAKDWSKMLVDGIARRAHEDAGVLSDEEAFAAFAKELVGQWEGFLSSYVQGRAESGKPVQWYEEAKFEKGAFATLLAVRVERSADSMGARWTAAALGDSCFFHLRGGELLHSFPLTKTDEFGTTPALFGSRNHDYELIAERTQFASGQAEPGDILFLMTDALAAWFLGLGEKLSGQLGALEHASTGQQVVFDQLVDSLRSSKQLHNDDVALVRIDI